AQVYGECCICRNTVRAKTEDLVVLRFEFGYISLIRLHLVRSTTGEREHIKAKHHIFFAAKVAQLVTHASVVLADDGARQSKVRRLITNFKICVRRRRRRRFRRRRTWCWLRRRDRCRSQ